MSEQAIKALQDAIEYEASTDYASQIAKLKAQLASAEQAQSNQSARRLQLEQAMELLTAKPSPVTIEPSVHANPDDTTFGT